MYLTIPQILDESLKLRIFVTGLDTSIVPLQTYGVLEKVLIAKEAAEEYLRASGLEYTIIRPGGLLSGAVRIISLEACTLQLSAIARIPLRIKQETNFMCRENQKNVLDN